MKKFLTLLILLYAAGISSAELPQYDKNIHIHVWAELDAYPELEEAQDTSSPVFEYTKNRIKETAPFLINGMVYGWNFVYTPSDKLRNIEDYFEITPINTIDTAAGKIVYEKPWIQDNLVHIWTGYTRTPEEEWSYKTWTSVNTGKTQGTGKAPVKKGFDGITEAAKLALKDGIRNFYRPIIKNKPKEIRGKVIIRNEPKIGITEGRYTVKLDFFIETDRIIKYTTF